MKLSAPKMVTWWIAVVLGLLGVLGRFVPSSAACQSLSLVHDCWLAALCSRDDGRQPVNWLSRLKRNGPLSQLS